MRQMNSDPMFPLPLWERAGVSDTLSRWERVGVRGVALLLAISYSLFAASFVTAKEMDEDRPIGMVGGQVHADLFTGVATTSIPIEVPPGRNGMQPNLQLVYESAGGNGWVGMGWKLELGAIERQTRFGVNYSADDYAFRLNGTSGDFVSVGSGEYRAKIEGGFTRAKKLTATDGKPYWELTDKRGIKYLFGQTTASRMADPANANNIFKWCLDRAEDTNGNYLTVTYVGDQGQGYLSQIDYTGNGATAPTHTVKFWLEDRSDTPPMYTTHYLVKTAKRLKTIEIKANCSPACTLVRAYKVGYATSGPTQRSLLASVQQFGKDATLDGSGTVISGTALPPMTASYTSLSNAPQIWTWTNGADWASGYEMISGDFNGDGKLDIYLHGRQGTGNWDNMGLSTGNGFQVWTWTNGGDWSSYAVTTGDFNGDGKTDIYLYPRLGWAAQHNMGISTGNGFQIWTWSCGCTWGGYEVIPGDYNGDGKTDIYLHGQYGTNNWDNMGLSTGTGFNIWTWSNGSSWTNYEVLSGDFNGDGKTDIILHGRQGTGGWTNMGLSTGTSFQVWTWTNGSDWSNYEVIPQDFNGDGKTDLLLHGRYGSGGWTNMGLSNGTSFQVWTWTSGSDWSIYEVAPGDFNGDSKADLYIRGRFGTGGWDNLGYSTGTGFNVWSWSNGGDWSGYQMHPGDYNGDGKTDIYIRGRQGTSGWDNFGIFSPEQPATDLLTSIVNGLGSTTTIVYSPSTLHPNTQLPFPLQRVNSITTNDGNGNVAATSYTYSGGFYHIGERDIRGVNYAKVTGPVGPNGEQTISETWFHQGNDTAVPSSDPPNANVANGYMKGKPYRTQVKDAAGNLYSKTETSYTADDNGAAPFFTPPAQIDSFTYDGTLGSSKQTRAILTHDAYGNVTREDQYGDYSTSADDKTVVRDFATSLNTSAWIVGLPASETVYSGIGTTNQVAQSTFYYDGTTSCGTASTNQVPSQGNLTRIIRWLSGGTSPDTRMAYDSFGNRLCSRDANGNTTTLTYDSSNTFPLTVTNALAHTVTTIYYGVNGQGTSTGLYGQLKSVTDANTQTVSHEYDALGRKTKVTPPDSLTTTMAYTSFGGGVGTQHIQTTKQASATVSLSSWTYFDGLGRTIKKKSTGPDSKTIVTDTQYNPTGTVLKTSLPYFESGGSALWRVLEHDPLGRVTKVTLPDSTRILSCTDDWVSTTVDATNHKKREVKDAAGRVLRIDEYTGTTTTCETAAGTPYASTLYSYDVLGNLMQVTDAKGNISTMTYDTLSRKTAMHDPDMGDWLYSYDPVGNLLQQRDAKNQLIHFQYDQLNRRRQKDYGTQKTLGSGDVVYTYDQTTHGSTATLGIGRLTSRQDSAGLVKLYYDGLGRTLRTDKTIDSTTYTTESAYDGLGRLQWVKHPDTSVVPYAYNGPFVLNVSEGATVYGAYAGYNAMGQPATLTHANGVVTTYTYQANTFRTASINSAKGSTTLQNLSYGYDNEGNVTSITDPINGNQTFSYDELDRLTNATGPYGSFTYAYNEIGNLTTNPQVGSYTYPVSGATSVRPHAVSTAGSNTYSYDANGNLTSGAGRTLTWDAENRPTSITSGGTTTTFVYDGDGKRIKKTVGTTTTLYISKLYECETNTGGTFCTKFILTGQDKRLAMKQVGGAQTVDYYHPDHLGSTSVMTTSAGVQQQAVTYYPFGNVRSNSGSINVPYKYTGKELDTSTGLMFYEARYYDATLARFVSADTIVARPRDPQDLNRYAYARNNPLLYTDPTGHFFKKFFKVLGDRIAEVGKNPLKGVDIFYHAKTYLQLAGANPIGRATGFYEVSREYDRFYGSETGRWVRGSTYFVAAVAGTIACAGTCGPVLMMGALKGAAIGSGAGLAKAGLTGGNPVDAVTSGLISGAISGGIAGGLEHSVGHAVESGLNSTAWDRVTDLAPLQMDQVNAMYAAHHAAGELVGAAVGGLAETAIKAGIEGHGLGNNLIWGVAGNIAFSAAAELSPLGQAKGLLAQSVAETPGVSEEVRQHKKMHHGMDVTPKH